MHGLHVYQEIPFLREATTTARMGAGVVLTFSETLTAMLNLDVLFEFALRGAETGALGTDWWMRGADMCLQEGVGGKAEFLVLGVGIRGFVWVTFNTFRTPETCSTMNPSFVRSKLASCFKAVRAMFPSHFVDLRAWIRLLVQVD